jgi:hypothetical protein
MILRQGCARVVLDPGAHNTLNLGECARVRQDRQGPATYYVRAREMHVFSFFLYINNSEKTLAILADPVFMRSCRVLTLAQPWRNPGGN